MDQPATQALAVESSRAHLDALGSVALAACLVLLGCGAQDDDARGGGTQAGAIGGASVAAASGTAAPGPSPGGGSVVGGTTSVPTAGTSGTGAPAGTGGGVGGADGLSGAGGTTAGSMPPPAGGAAGNGAVGGTSGTSGVGGAIDTGGTGDAGPTGGTDGVAGSTAGAGGTGAANGCTPAPSGTFQTMTEPGGPGGAYAIYRPTTLGEGGLKHPPIAWGNGLGTVPGLYDATLREVASHGFVVIGNPGPGSDPQVVRQGLEWLIDQNNSGIYAGNLAVDCAGTIGYSMGGGAAVGSGAHPAVKAIVSIHGLQDAAENASGPILILTSDGDTFVPKERHAVPCFTRSSVQPTVMATHVGQPAAPGFGDHLEPLGGGVMDTDPMIAWLRFWIYGDEAQRSWFFGPTCTLCGDDWTDIQQKNYDWGR